MSQKFNLAIIGDGSTAVNAAYHLARFGQIEQSRLITTVYGKNPEACCGGGFAYGNVGSAFGNLTESPLDGCADYHPSTQGEFAAYAAQRLGVAPEAISVATRQLIGDFHRQRFCNTRELAASQGGQLNFRQADIVDLKATDDGWNILTSDGSVGHAQHVTLALGDVLSQRFTAAARQFAGRVFQTPYHAVQPILQNNGSDQTVIALGTQSSFADLVIGLGRQGYEGRIIGVSSTGKTSWQARQGRSLYECAYLTEQQNSASNLTVNAVLGNLFGELKNAAQNAGCWVPESLLEAIQTQAAADRPSQIKWNFSIKDEATHADGLTYHEVVMAAPWEKIYANLASPSEREKFNEVLASFILYNRVNRIVPQDYKELIDHFDTSRSELKQGSFDQNSIKLNDKDELQVTLEDGSTIAGDYVVNCAGGPVSAHDQIQSVPLLANLVSQGALIAHDHGTGFDVAATNLSVIGAQGRATPFAGIGLQSYGRQIGAWVPARVNDINQRLGLKTNLTEYCHG